MLRHGPESFGLVLERGGWVNVDTLLDALAKHAKPVQRDELIRIVQDDEKQRFALSSDGSRIRANQGHSIEVELDFTPMPPPALLYHGTIERFWPVIERDGLLRGARHHVHLSPSVELAEQVGARRGPPLVLEIRARDMTRDGYVFYRSANGVWLTEHVPAAYLLRRAQRR